MEDIWQQFHRLPREIRDSVATPEALATVEKVEEEHPGLDLANFIMRVMVKEFPFAELPQRLEAEGKMQTADAKDITSTLSTSVFSQVKEYLGLIQSPPPAAPTPVGMSPVLAPPPAPRPVETKPVVPLPVAPVHPTPPVNLPTKSLAVPPPALPTPPPIRPLNIPPLPIVPLAAPAKAVSGPVAPTQAYSDEDAREIANQEAKLKAMTPASDAVGLDALAQQVMDQHRLAYGDELLTRRALTLFKSRLKDIRDSETTIAILTRDPKIGGLGMDPDMAANVVVTLEQKMPLLKSRGMVTPIEPPAPIVPPPVPAVVATRPTPIPPLNTTLPPEPAPGAPPLPVLSPRPTMPLPQIKRPADIPVPWSSTPPAAVVSQPPPASLPPSAPPAPPGPPVMQRNRVMERPSVTDISRPAVSFGPAGEMQSLTLVEFRRLGQGAGEATRRLLDKFEHWKNESFKIWSEAVAGWRKSEVHQLYLEMGRQSLETNQPIRDIIQQHASQNRPYLSEHEFNVIADFNQQLQS